MNAIKSKSSLFRCKSLENPHFSLLHSLYSFSFYKTEIKHRNHQIYKINPHKDLRTISNGTIHNNKYYTMLGYHHQHRFETMNIYKRPKYVNYPDGSRWIIGTTIRISPEGKRINTSIKSFQEINDETLSARENVGKLSQTEEIKMENNYNQTDVESIKAGVVEQTQQDEIETILGRDKDGFLYQNQNENENEDIEELESDEEIDLDEEEVEEGDGDLDIRNVKGIGPKSGKILRANGINTVDELFNVIQTDKQLFEELNNKIRGFGKIVERVNEMCKQ